MRTKFTSPSVSIFLTQKNIAKFLDECFLPYNITPEQFTLFHQIFIHPMQNQKMLAEKTNRDQASLTKMLDTLEKKGLVVRLKNQIDRRSFLIDLTEEGRKLITELEPITDIVEDVLNTSITKDEFQTLIRILNKINDSLDINNPTLLHKKTLSHECYTIAPHSSL